MADAKVSEAAKKAARLNVRPDLGAGYFTDERETWAMGYVAGAAAERAAIMQIARDVRRVADTDTPDPVWVADTIITHIEARKEQP